LHALTTGKLYMQNSLVTTHSFVSAYAVTKRTLTQNASYTYKIIKIHFKSENSKR